MKLTGKQLFEWWNDSVQIREWDELACSEIERWDALAEKLNGMMAGEKEMMPIERTNRHSGKSDPQTNSVETPVRSNGGDICKNCNHDRDCHTDSSDGRTCSTYTDYEKGEICGCEQFSVDDRARTTDQQQVLAEADYQIRARHHATCPYRHGTGDCNC